RPDHAAVRGRIEHPAGRCLLEPSHITAEPLEADRFLENDCPACNRRQRQAEHHQQNDGIGMRNQPDNRKIATCIDRSSFTHSTHPYFDNCTFGTSDDTLIPARHSESSPASDLHSRTSLTSRLPMPSQAMPSRSNSLTTRFFGLS